MWMAATGLTAYVLTVVPVVVSTLVTVMAYHVLPAPAGSGVLVTVTVSVTTVGLDGASSHTSAA